jgi:hypothetical protein
MVQTGLGFSSVKPNKSTRKAARKTKQIEKLLHLLKSENRSLSDTITSLAHLVGEPVDRGRRGKKTSMMFRNQTYQLHLQFYHQIKVKLFLIKNMTRLYSNGSRLEETRCILISFVLS